MAGKRNRTAYEADLQAVKSPYVFYGTPLPPLDSNVRDDGSFVPIWKQEVTDERGRKRLHGAFTGGFSAGYYNTVGSKEGWTPATFVSSKSNRFKDSGQQAQNAEDFMDEEDKAEAEEARQMSTKPGFAVLGNTENEVKKRAPLMDLFQSSADNMGFNLLRKMGWKDGQGIGPRTWRTANLADQTIDDKTASEKHLFAPRNSKLILIFRKDDRKGLGYGSNGALEKPTVQTVTVSDDEETSFSIKPKPKKSVARKSAFGVGVLNDTGSDDEDPYSLGPKISYSKILGSDKKKKKKAVNSNPLLSTKPVFRSKGLSGFKKCHDGRLPLEGFILSIKKPNIEPNKYPPSKVPDDWKPARLATASVEVVANWQSSSDLAKASSHDPSTRGNLLGETALPSKSVFDFMKPDARARLVTLTNNNALPPAGSESAPSLPVEDSTTAIPPLDPTIASTALGRGIGGFVPYLDNPEKLARYRAYLSYAAGLSPDAPRPENVDRSEFLRELQEFAHAATIFKPMTGSIATRFVTASSKPNTSTTSDHNTTSDLSSEKSKDPAEEAAHMGMFGHLTRSSYFFYPSRLLCKRFNVPVPVHVNAGNEGSSVAKARAGHMDHRSSAAPSNSFGASSKWQSSGYQVEKQEPVAGLMKLSMDKATAGAGGVEMLAAKEINIDRNEALEQERPGDDVFKAIFGDDSDDD